MIADGGAKHNKITNTLTYFLRGDNRPFYTVEGRGYQKLIKIIAPLYKVPSKDNIKNKMDVKYELMYATYKEKIAQVEHIYLPNMWHLE